MGRARLPDEPGLQSRIDHSSVRAWAALIEGSGLVHTWRLRTTWDLGSRESETFWTASKVTSPQ